MGAAPLPGLPFQLSSLQPLRPHACASGPTPAAKHVGWTTALIWNGRSTAAWADLAALVVFDLLDIAAPCHESLLVNFNS